MKEEWEMKTLGEVCDLVGGGTPSKKKSAYYGGNIPWATIRDLSTDTLTKTEHSITQEALANSSSNIIPRDNVVIATRVGLGKICIIKQDTAINQDLRGIIPKKKSYLQVRYLFFWFNSIRSQIIAAGTGATVQGVKVPFVKSLQIPVPPLTEQEAIVQVLDKAFTAIDQAKANLEQNITNAQQLFQSKLNQIFSQQGEGWVEKELSEVTTKIGSGSTPRGGQASYKESGISLVRSMNVHDRGFKPDKLAFIDDDQASKLNNVTLEANDVLLNITGASVARCCIIEDVYLPARVNQHVSIIRLKPETVLPKFIHYALTSPHTKDILLGIGEQGATRQAITKKQIESFSIAFPDLDKQKMLIKQLDEVETHTSNLVTHYQSKLTSLTELKKSLLQKAFAGELT